MQSPSPPVPSIPKPPIGRSFPKCSHLVKNSVETKRIPILQALYASCGDTGSESHDLYRPRSEAPTLPTDAGHRGTSRALCHAGTGRCNRNSRLSSTLRKKQFVNRTALLHKLQIEDVPLPTSANFPPHFQEDPFYVPRHCSTQDRIDSNARWHKALAFTPNWQSAHGSPLFRIGGRESAHPFMSSQTENTTQLSLPGKTRGDGLRSNLAHKTVHT